MSEWTINGVPISLVFLYFLWYSFLGWAFETAYCSIKARGFVYRGFLEGPVCPIYGVGALLMVLFLQPLLGHPVLLYLAACVVMSAWEYLVGWLLETATHVKYWDYSHLPFNLKGRICLFISVWWGVLAYFAIGVIHPATVELFGRLQPPLRWWIAGASALVLLADTVTTVRQLAVTTQLLERAEQSGRDLLAKRRELGEAARQRVSEAADAARLRAEQAADEARLKAVLASMELRHGELVRQAAQASRRFRNRYRGMTTQRYRNTFNLIREQAARLRSSRKGGR